MVIPTKSQNHRDKELYTNFNIERSSNFAKKLCRGCKLLTFFSPCANTTLHTTQLLCKTG